jgi:hypothetical protein
MPTTRHQAALQEANKEQGNDVDMKPEKKVVVGAGENREAGRATKAKRSVRDESESPAKKAKREESSQKGRESEFKPQTGKEIVDALWVITTIALQEPLNEAISISFIGQGSK